MSRELINAIVERDMGAFYKLVKISDVNWCDPLGMRAIHYVIRLYPDRLLIDVIRTLKINGADLDATDNYGDRPIHFACCRSRPIFALNILEEYGASMGDFVNDNGASAMHFLFCNFSECNDFENIFKTMEYLQEKGFDMSQTDENGATAKDYAEKKFGKLNSMLWKLSATLKHPDAIREIKIRARTRRLSAGSQAKKVVSRARRRSIADTTSAMMEYRV